MQPFISLLDLCLRVVDHLALHGLIRTKQFPSVTTGWRRYSMIYFSAENKKTLFLLLLHKKIIIIKKTHYVKQCFQFLT